MPRLVFFLLTVALCAQETSDLTQALKASRRKIDYLDAEIVKLLNERAAVVREIGLVKKRYHAPAIAQGREEEVLRRVSSEARAPLTADDMTTIYRAILAEMTSMEQREMEKGSGR